MTGLPPEFFSPEELAEILETPQPVRQRELLAKNGVPFVTSASGKPRVYRDRLLPTQQVTQNEVFDFSALASRQTKKAA